MKKIIFILLVLLSTSNFFAQTYNEIISDSLINELMVYEVNHRVKNSDDQKLWKKRITAEPIQWKMAIINILGPPNVDFEFQKNALIQRDYRYNHDSITLSDMFTESDFDFMEKQFNSEKYAEWNFRAKKGKIKKTVRNNYYSYSVPLFNINKDKAIIYSEFGGCGELCGGGSIYVYVKDNNHWNLYRTIPCWES